MQDTYRRIQTKLADHTTFGGVIYPSDFNTDHKGKRNMKSSLTANRIALDMRFDEACRKNALKLKNED